jgi:hypothetical protein
MLVTAIQHIPEQPKTKSQFRIFCKILNIIKTAGSGVNGMPVIIEKTGIHRVKKVLEIVFGIPHLPVKKAQLTVQIRVPVVFTGKARVADIVDRNKSADQRNYYHVVQYHFRANASAFYPHRHPPGIPVP